jgi:ligand-binding sensor domain-containing protein
VTHFTPNKHLFLALLLFTPLCLFAQTGNYNIYHYAVANGLPTNNCKVVYQDSYGYLWTASYDGLSKWDGYSFHKYNHDENDSHSIDNNIVYSIFEDSKKRLWIGTIEGLNLYDREQDCFTRCIIGREERLPVNAILEDSHHQLWLGTSDGLCKYDHDHQSSRWFTHKSNEDVIFCLSKDKEDNIWIGTLEKGVRMFSQQSQTIRNIKSPEKIKSILVDSQQQIWIGTVDKGIFVLNKQGDIIKKYDHKNAVTALYEDHQKTIWVGVDRQPVHYIKGAEEPRALNGNVISVASICEDTFSNLWFGSCGNGLFYTNQHKNIFHHYLQDTSVITSFYEDAKGYIWMGTDKNGLLKFDPVKKTFHHYLNNEAINEIRADHDGNLWLATWGEGVIQFDPVTQKRINYHHLVCNDVKMLLPDDSVILIGTHGKGLLQYNKQHRFTDKNAAPAWINHLFKDSRKRLWVSTYSGIYLIDGDKTQQFKHSKDTNSISSNAASGKHIPLRNS